MAKTEAEVEAMEAELAASKKALLEMQAQAKTTEGQKEKEKERNASPGKVAIDPDLAKEMQEMKLKIAALEKRLGSGGGAFDFVDLFKSK